MHSSSASLFRHQTTEHKNPKGPRARDSESGCLQHIKRNGYGDRGSDGVSPSRELLSRPSVAFGRAATNRGVALFFSVLSQNPFF